MKRFIIKSAIFIVFCTALALFVEYVYYRYSGWEKTIDGWEVYTAIKNSKAKQCKKKLLIGDSVGMQLFPCNEEIDSVALCTCNQAVTMAGFYMMMKNYLETNNECLPDKVILLVTPLSLRNYVDEYTYHYFLKPFTVSEYGNEYTPLLKSRLKNIPNWWTASLPFIRISMYMEKYIPKEGVQTLLSPLAKEYLQKMHELAEESGVKLEMRSAPVKECHRADIESKLYQLPQYPEYVQDYFMALDYMQDSCYMDKVHFTEEMLQIIEKDYLLK